MSSYQERLIAAIPGGAHTYSRGHDQFPANAPQILDSGRGVYVTDPLGNRYLDFGMALRSVNLGYSEKSVNKAAYKQIKKGNNLTRASMVELEAAERFIDIVDSAEMVKFTKNGSTAVTGAVKLARAYTRRELVVRCSSHPFFSYDDWFISDTVLERGIPQDVKEKTLSFAYNDIESLKRIIESHPGQIACVVLEPAAMECPCEPDSPGICCGGKSWSRESPNFLRQVQTLCANAGILFILDEMITGFRWHVKGAQHAYGVTPDLSTFGKAMANGFSVACVAGKREIMELGSIERTGEERVFLLSTTHGAEMSSLGAFLATMDFMEKHDVVSHLWQFGEKFKRVVNEVSESHGLLENFRVEGPDCSPYFIVVNRQNQSDLALRTLLSQEMVKNGILMPWLAFAFRHGEKELRAVRNALDKSLMTLKRGLNGELDMLLEGAAIRPVFRKFN